MNLDFPLQSILQTTKNHLGKLEKMGIYTVRDLLEFYPRAIESTDIKSRAENIEIGAKNTVSGYISGIERQSTPRGRKISKALFTLDDGAVFDVIWFQIPYMLKNLRADTRVFLIGKIEYNYGRIQIVNPEIHTNADVHVGGIRAIYSESPPITSKWLREKLYPLLPITKEFSQLLPNDLVREQNLLFKPEAVHAIHHPKDNDQWQAAKRTLAFEEIFGIQAKVIHAKALRKNEKQSLYHIPLVPEEIQQDMTRIPFELTTAQKKVLYVILKDFEKEKPAHRLIQGDVGSGKTIVAFMAALQALKQGYQVAFLAPTEILAKQHFISAAEFFPDQYPLDLLTGSIKASKKKEIKTQLANGSLKLLFGTHAILTDDTEFNNLAVAVIDEQHRFGVKQRQILADTGAHILSMTATPIPRTLALTIYGDQDLSVIDELPAGRKPIITRVISDTKKETLCHRFIDDQIHKGYQIFWVVPLVEESETIEAKNAKQHYEHVAQDMFPKRRVGILHGKMKPKDKEATMAAFRNKEYDILVSTSVIEVGVDIPNATVMCIENSERFGLSQLHQFRGRIGRNDRQSYCFLMVGKKDDAQKERLQAMERSNDGFYLAEIDLKLRGAGEVYGIKQSGLPDLKCADLTDSVMMSQAREAAQEIFEKDPMLEQHPSIRAFLDSQEVYL